MITATLPLPPSANRLWRRYGARTVKSIEARAFEESAAFALRNVDTPYTGAVSVQIVVYFPTKAGDLDNRAKPVLDCLQGVAFANDKQVTELHMLRRVDKHNPRVEVTVSEAKA